MPSAQELCQERAAVWEQAKALLDKAEGGSGSLDATEQEQYDRLSTRMDELGAEIKKDTEQRQRQAAARAKLDAVAVELRAPTSAPVIRPGPATGGDVESRTKALHERQMRAFRELILGEGPGRCEFRGLQVDSGQAGGYLIAPAMLPEILRDLTNMTFMRSKARVLPALSTSDEIEIPVRVSGMGAITWAGEKQAAQADTSLALGLKRLRPTAAKALIKATKKFLRLASLGPEAFIQSEIQIAYALGLEQAYMSGSGAGQPLGVFTPSVDGISTDRDVSDGNTATSIKVDGLISAVSSVKAQWRAGAEWILHRLGIDQVRKLKDAVGAYIWQPSVQAGQPDRLLGFPVNESEYAPSTFTASLYVGLFGNLQYYYIVDVLGMEIERLVEIYSGTDEIGFKATLETDGKPVRENAFARVKLAAA